MKRNVRTPETEGQRSMIDGFEGTSAKGHVDVGKPSTLRLLLICRCPTAVGIALMTRHPKTLWRDRHSMVGGRIWRLVGDAGSDQSSSSAPLILVPTMLGQNCLVFLLEDLANATHLDDMRRDGEESIFG
jgi:hypothetical protein